MPPTNDDHEWLIQGSGVYGHVSPESGILKGKKLDEVLSFHLRTEAHLWVALCTFQLTVESLDKLAEEPLNTDIENMLSAQIGCFICEQPYSRKLLRRRCPGEPR